MSVALFRPQFPIATILKFTAFCCLFLALQRYRGIHVAFGSEGIMSIVVRVHGPRVTVIQMRARCGSMRTDLASFGPEVTPKNTSACRTEERQVWSQPSRIGELLTRTNRRSGGREAGCDRDIGQQVFNPAPTGCPTI